MLNKTNKACEMETTIAYSRKAINIPPQCVYWEYSSVVAVVISVVTAGTKKTFVTTTLPYSTSTEITSGDHSIDRGSCKRQF